MRGKIGPGRWMKQLREYMGEMGLSFDMLRNMTMLGVNQVVDRWETRRWRKDLDNKTTLRIYRNKVDIGEEGIYRNTYGSVLMFRCRTNTLGLRWRNIFSGDAVEHRRRRWSISWWSVVV